MLALLGRTIAMTVVACGIGFAVNALRPDGVSLRAFVPPVSCQSAAGEARPEVLDPGATAHLCGDPGVLIADARSARQFAEGHVAGAIHLPCAATGAAATEAMALLHDKHTLIVYGDTTDEAEPVADELGRRAGGPLRVVIIKGGFPAWNQAGLACSSGPCPGCKDSLHQ